MEDDYHNTQIDLLQLWSDDAIVALMYVMVCEIYVYYCNIMHKNSLAATKTRNLSWGLWYEYKDTLYDGYVIQLLLLYLQIFII